MKFDELRSIGHNVADSFACGNGFLVGYYSMDIFGEASRSPGGFITVDFLTGTCRAGTPSQSLVQAIALYRDGFANLCVRHGTSISAFRELTVCYSVSIYGPRFVVTVEDHQGRRSEDEYLGIPGKRPMVRDERGRVRRKPSIKSKR